MSQLGQDIPKICPKILIVEDDQDLRETMQEIFALEGFDADAAENGKVALEKLSEPQLPCLILLDLMMPVMTGWQFLDVVKSENAGALSNIPIVVVSAVADLDFIKEIYQCAAMNKPADVHQLISLARQYCVQH